MQGWRDEAGIGMGVSGEGGGKGGSWGPWG